MAWPTRQEKWLRRRRKACHPERSEGTGGTGGAQTLIQAPPAPPGPSLTLGVTGEIWRSGQRKRRGSSCRASPAAKELFTPFNVESTERKSWAASRPAKAVRRTKAFRVSTASPKLAKKRGRTAR